MIARKTRASKAILLDAGNALVLVLRKPKHDLGGCRFYPCVLIKRIRSPWQMLLLPLASQNWLRNCRLLRSYVASRSRTRRSVSITVQSSPLGIEPEKRFVTSDHPLCTEDTLGGYISLARNSSASFAPSTSVMPSSPAA
jgi:hypothetical protein